MTNNQDTVMENIMLFSPMPVLQAIQDSFTESMLADEYMDCEEIFGDSVPVRNVRKCDRKERARRHRKANRTHKTRDRYHGKKGEEYRYAEGACRDMRLYNSGLIYDRNIRQERLETAKLRDALDVSLVERLTASVLAHMSNHVFMWDERVVWDLTEALCEEYRQAFPDDSYICVYGKHVNLYMQYMDGSVIQDERCYTLR